MAGFFVGGGTLLPLKGFSQKTLLWVVGVTALCFYLPDIVLGSWRVAGSRRSSWACPTPWT